MAHNAKHPIAERQVINLSPLEVSLLNDYQRGFPLESRPYAELATELGVSEEVVLDTLEALQEEGFVSRVGPVFAPHRVGASTLAALAVPQERLEAVAAQVTALPEVNHNYQREHHYNLWFVATAPDQNALDQVLVAIEEATGLPVLVLPMLEEFHIDLGFDWCKRAGE